MPDLHFCHTCGDDIPTARHNLGYRTCLNCGDKEARGVKRCVVNMSKSNYILITNHAELAWLNPKRVGE